MFDREEYYRQWRAANAEKKREADRQYYAENKERVRATVKKYRDSHKEQYRTYHMEYYETHKEEIRAKCKEYQLAHFKEKRARDKAYCVKNRERLLPLHRERYHRKMADPAERVKQREAARLRYHQIREVWNAQRRENYRIYGRANNRSKLTRGIIQAVYTRNLAAHTGILTCCLCGRPIGEHKENLEHLVPLERGGSNDLDNLDIAHCFCNLMKGRRTLSEWLVSDVYENLMRNYDSTVAACYSGMKK